MQNFNTSHVTVYLIALLKIWDGICDFNTSHVTVYLIALLKIWDGICDFNTSHVTVYQEPDQVDILVKLEFQYISCYGLSKWQQNNEWN